MLYALFLNNPPRLFFPLLLLSTPDLLPLLLASSVLSISTALTTPLAWVQGTTIRGRRRRWRC